MAWPWYAYFGVEKGPLVEGCFLNMAIIIGIGALIDAAIHERPEG